jgi:hypothetical protein
MAIYDGSHRQPPAGVEAADRLPRDSDTKRANRAARAQRSEAARQRRFRAFGLRLDGWSYREIGQALQVSNKQAFADVQAEAEQLSKVAREGNSRRRQIMLAQIDRAKRHLAPKIAAGDIRAAETLVKLLDRESRLLGTDAPSKVAAVVAVGEVDGALEPRSGWNPVWGEEDSVNDLAIPATMTEAERKTWSRLARIRRATPEALARLSDDELILLHRVQSQRMMGPPQPLYDGKALRIGGLLYNADADALGREIDALDHEAASLHASSWKVFQLRTEREQLVARRDELRRRQLPAVVDATLVEDGEMWG